MCINFVFFVRGRNGGVPSHIPNVVMSRASQMPISRNLLPSSVRLYQQDGGSITEVSSFRCDPLLNYQQKKDIRYSA